MKRMLQTAVIVAMLASAYCLAQEDETIGLVDYRRTHAIQRPRLPQDRNAGFYSEFDFMFLKMTQADSLKDANQDPASFDHELVPRVTVGYRVPDYFGVRVRYWEHDASTISAGNVVVSTDTYVIDAEAFQKFWVTYRTNIEGSFGLRYTGFSFDRGANDLYTLNNAFGLVAGGQINQLTRMGILYGRARGGLVTGDGIIESSVNAQDLIRSQVELAVGLEKSWSIGCVNVNGRVGYEVFSLNNYVGTNDDDDQVTDLGLHGFVFGLGISR